MYIRKILKIGQFLLYYEPFCNKITFLTNFYCVLQKYCNALEHGMTSGGHNYSSATLLYFLILLKYLNEIKKILPLRAFTAQVVCQ